MDRLPLFLSPWALIGAGNFIVDKWGSFTLPANICTRSDSFTKSRVFDADRQNMGVNKRIAAYGRESLMKAMRFFCCNVAVY